MTRLLATVLLACLILPAILIAKVTVSISGGTEHIDSFDEKNITYVSLSGLADILGGKTDWEIIGHQIRYTEDTLRFDFWIDSPFFRTGDSLKNLTLPARFRDGQLFVPIYAFLPYFDRVHVQRITWERPSKTIRINSEYFNVTDLAISSKANGLLVEIYLTGEMAYEIFVTEGNWLNVSIRDGRIAPRVGTRRDSRYMYSLKTHQLVQAGQISIRLKRNIEKWTHRIALDPPRIQISIADTGFQLDSSMSPAEIGPDDKIDLIVIDPGHGGSDYGAIGQRGTREKDVALNISRELAKLIRKDKQFKVVMTRDRDKTLTLKQRADIANRSAADLFISIHANASLKTQVRGWNVFFLAPAKNDSARSAAQLENSAFLKDISSLDRHRQESDPIVYDDPIGGIISDMLQTEFQAESHDFAMMCDREVRRAVNIPARGVDQAGFFVLNQVFSPSVLVESGFISNKSEEKLLKSRKFQKKLARAIYNAIKRFRNKYER
ncbi:MAG: N-acetylmuramoyl-L-alanine amidase [Candidatus Zixiibacteriota bacterium]